MMPSCYIKIEIITKKASKTHHEPEKEPDPSSHGAEAAISEAFPPEETVGHRVHHEHGDGGEDAAEVEHVPCVLVVRGRGIDGEPPS